MISPLSNPDAWKDEDTLVEQCAKQLVRGRVALVLGAGASDGFGLPNWSILTDRMFASAGVSRPPGKSDERAAELLLQTHCSGDDLQFAALVREELYRDFNFNPAAIGANSLLAAICTFSMASSRGGAAVVVTFNFDVVLETYLSYFGLRSDSVGAVPAWDSNADIRVFHPHGVLKATGAVTRGVVYCLSHFDRVVGNTADAWHRVLLDIFTAHTCIFVGVSGDDPNLTSLLTKTKGIHASTESGHAYWGVRLTTGASANPEVWEARGVRNHVLADYDRIPEFLLRVCRKAAELAQR